MADIRAYVLNESLLDEVGSDEVKDDSSFKICIAVSFRREFAKPDTVEKSFKMLVDSYLGRLEDSGYLRSYSINLAKDCLCVYINLIMVDDDNESFVKMIARIASLFNKYDYGFNIVVMNERGDFILNVLFASPVVSEKFSLLQINDSYYDCFGVNDFAEFIRTFVQVTAASGVLFPSDKQKDRFVINFTDSNLIRMYDAKGNELFEHAVDDFYINGSSNVFNEYGLMYITFSNDRNNYLTYDGELLFENYNMGAISEGKCVVYDSGRNKYNYYDVVKKKLLLDDWVYEAEGFENGVALFSRKYEDEFVMIDSDGNEICHYDTILFDDEHHYALVWNTASNKYNFIDNTGRVIWKGDWFDGGHTPKYNYAKVSRKKSGSNDILVNFLNLETGKIVSGTWFNTKKGNIDDIYYPVVNDIFIVFDRDSRSYNLYDGKENKLLFKNGFFNQAEPCNEYDKHFFKMGMTSSIDNTVNYKIFLDNGQMLGDKKDWFSDVAYLGEDLWSCQKIGIGKNKFNMLIKSDGTVLVDYCDWSFTSFSDGYSLVQRGLNDKVKKTKNKFNLIDTSGKLIREEWFNYVGIMKDGFAEVRNRDNSLNLLMKNGRFLFPKKGIENIQKFEVIEAGRIVVLVDKDYRYNVVDSNGKYMFDEWIDAKISANENDSLKIGDLIIADYEGNIVSYI